MQTTAFTEWKDRHFFATHTKNRVGIFWCCRHCFVKIYDLCISSGNTAELLQQHRKECKKWKV
jgi:hypothetical protein